MGELDLYEKSTDHSLNVTTSSQEAVPENPDRTSLFVVNISDQRIHVQLGRDATTAAGIPLNSGGGALELNKTNLYKGSIHVIHGGTSNKVLCIVEIETRYGN